MRSWVIAALVLIAESTPAAQAHCHRLQAGKLTDLPKIKSQEACRDVGGVWKEHEPHCYTSKSGHRLNGVKDRPSCLRRGGAWADRGHEALAE